MEIIRKQRLSHAKLNVPTLVMVAAIGIVTIRCLDLLLLFDMLGVSGVLDFVHRSLQTRPLTLIFLASVLMFFLELCCAFAIVKGRNWGRWLFLLSQIICVVYLSLASLGWGYPELFSVAGASKHEIFRSLFTQKLPDILLLLLLFIPARSRLFFRLQ